jgi:iron-sulfur cluster repair protein YtfE (RIC family)
MSLPQNNHLEQMIKNHEAEKRELLNEMFLIGKRSETIHKENQKLSQAIKEMLAIIEEERSENSSEYHKGWNDALESISDRLRKALS